MELAKLLACLRDHFTGMVEAINEYIKTTALSEVTEEWQKSYPLKVKGGKVTGDLMLAGDKGQAVPQVKVPVDCGPVGWLKKALDAMRAKDEAEGLKPLFTYRILEDEGAISRIEFEGNLNEDRVKDLQSALAWTFDRGSKRKAS